MFIDRDGIRIQSSIEGRPGPLNPYNNVGKPEPEAGDHLLRKMEARC